MTGATQGSTGQSHCHTCSPILAPSVLVHRPPHSPPAHHFASAHSLIYSHKSAGIFVIPVWALFTSHLDFWMDVKDRLPMRQILTQSRRETTKACYQPKWKCFTTWARYPHHSLNMVSIPVVLDDCLALSSIRVHLAAFSAFLAPVDAPWSLCTPPLFSS